MATLINLPNDVQGHISNFLRPQRWTAQSAADLPAGVSPPSNQMNPFVKSPEVAKIQMIHRNLKTVSLWKMFEWKKRIQEWRDKNLTLKQWEYQYGTLPNQMIEKGWESKINNIYRHQGCYVKTESGALETGFNEMAREHKIIYFEVSLFDLITGIRPLPSAFGRAPRSEENLAAAGSLYIRMPSEMMVPEPTLETMIPKDKRREWLIECFMDCVLTHYIKKIIEKKGSAGEKPDFMKDFKEMMGLAPNYSLTETDLFKMFLRELQVRSGGMYAHDMHQYQRADSIDDLCFKELNILV